MIHHLAARNGDKSGVDIGKGGAARHGGGRWARAQQDRRGEHSGFAVSGIASHGVTSLVSSKCASTARAVARKSGDSSIHSAALFVP